MKRYISILIISTILLSLASCKKMPEDTIGTDIQAQGVQTDAPEQNEKQEQPESPTEKPVKEDKESTAEKTKDTADTAPEKAENAANESYADNKSEPEEDFTLDVPFSKYEVVVTLTDEETAKNKTYMPEDFPDLDIFNVYEQPDYYDFKFEYKDNKYKGKTTIMLMLNKPSKERVLEYVKILQNDTRVFDACPTLDEFSTSSFFVKMKDKSIKYTEDSFNYLDIGDFKIIEKTSFGSPHFYPSGHYGLGNDHMPIINIYFKNEVKKEKLIEEFKKLKNDPEVLYVIPDAETSSCYEHNKLSIELKNFEKPLEEYDINDFPKLKINNIRKSYFQEALVIEFDPDIRYLFKAYRILNSDSRVSKILYSNISFTYLN